MAPRVKWARASSQDSPERCASSRSCSPSSRALPVVASRRSRVGQGVQRRPQLHPSPQFLAEVVGPSISGDLSAASIPVCGEETRSRGQAAGSSSWRSRSERRPGESPAGTALSPDGSGPPASRTVAWRHLRPGAGSPRLGRQSPPPRSAGRAAARPLPMLSPWSASRAEPHCLVTLRLLHLVQPAVKVLLEEGWRKR